jgi:hypothetical protein
MTRTIAGDGTLSAREEVDRALLVAMPLRHLEAARRIAESADSAILPAGGPGALDEAAPGSQVLIIATEPDGAGVPAATWTATFGGRVDHEPGDPWPEGLPGTWLEEHGHRAAERPQGASPIPADANDEDDDDDDDDDERVGPQSFFRVSGLGPLPREEWVFANELVPKQRRGGRTFEPHAPVLVSRPD